ncbi:hypothetical protein FANTH_3641 [Fusarium anthophilum]|uniref:Uncharacterized protein n=1 Tax=Fusarium anthophilum TaxID=48485 RepID=A0A8H4ZS31_9HYPO|nr:hypothetical protein FANTH_3641 [Fusarium anthophilum]
MVFPEQEGIFASMARVVVANFRDSAQITARMLPIATTLGKLNEKRLNLIEQINEGLEDIYDTLEVESECVRGDCICSSLTLGVLSRMWHQYEHAEPPFITPFDGYSVSTALKLVKECIEPVPLHDNPGTDVPRYINPYDGRTYPCSIRGRMTPVLQTVERELCRMSPADFKA